MKDEEKHYCFILLTSSFILLTFALPLRQRVDAALLAPKNIPHQRDRGDDDGCDRQHRR